MSLIFDRQGNRKYLTEAERRAFLFMATHFASTQIKTFCYVLAYTGSRISEALAITHAQIDFADGIILIRSLKKRTNEDKIIYRAVPVPSWLLQNLDEIHRSKWLQEHPKYKDTRLWSWGRTIAWKRVKEIMVLSGITGPKATAKALRHTFAVLAIQKGVPLNIVCKWLGHANLETTAIYADAVGEEERNLAKRMWDGY